MFAFTTYLTINAAFNNGTGDHFYEKDGAFIAISRHIDIEVPAAYGFRFVPYDEVLALAAAEAKGVEAILGTEYTTATQDRLARAISPVTSRDNVANGRDGYYDEFPDAYGQNL